MYKSTRPDTFVTQVAKINRSDPRSVYHRLQKFFISCRCPEDRILWVEIDNYLNVVLLRSSIQRFLIELIRSEVAQGKSIGDRATRYL